MREIHDGFIFEPQKCLYKGALLYKVNESVIVNTLNVNWEVDIVWSTMASSTSSTYNYFCNI